MDKPLRYKSIRHWVFYWIVLSAYSPFKKPLNDFCKRLVQEWENSKHAS